MVNHGQYKFSWAGHQGVDLWTPLLFVVAVTSCEQSGGLTNERLHEACWNADSVYAKSWTQENKRGPTIFDWILIFILSWLKRTLKRIEAQFS